MIKRQTSYANRGAPFEGFVRFANDRYLVHKMAVIDKVPTEFIPLRDKMGRICGAKVEHKSVVDFIGRYKRYPIAIEAKHTSEDSIRFDEVQPHQAEYMDDFTEEPGTIGLVLVSFGLKHFYAIPWAFWQAAYNARVRPGATRTKPATVEAFGTTWTIPPKFSVRMDELDPSWEVTGTDQQFGLHYLENALKYITPRGEANHENATTS